MKTFVGLGKLTYKAEFPIGENLLLCIQVKYPRSSRTFKDVVHQAVKHFVEHAFTSSALIPFCKADEAASADFGPRLKASIKRQVVTDKIEVMSEVRSRR